MNLCFFIGKVCSNLNFEFILNSKDISVCIFDIELSNGSRIKVKGYNEIADYCYSKLKKDMMIIIEGSINQNIEVILKVVNVLE